MRAYAVAAAALALFAGCGASDSSSVEEELVRGLEQIRSSTSATELHGQITRTLAGIRRAPTSTASDRRGRRLAIQGFASTLRGIDAQLDLIENDSGNLEAAVRDAARADRYRSEGAELLRAAGRAFALAVGTLKGY